MVLGVLLSVDVVFCVVLLLVLDDVFVDVVLLLDDFDDELFLFDVDLLELFDELADDEYGQTPFACRCGGFPPQW